MSSHGSLREIFTIFYNIVPYNFCDLVSGFKHLIGRPGNVRLDESKALKDGVFLYQHLNKKLLGIYCRLEDGAHLAFSRPHPANSRPFNIFLTFEQLESLFDKFKELELSSSKDSILIHYKTRDIYEFSLPMPDGREERIIIKNDDKKLEYSGDLYLNYKGNKNFKFSSKANEFVTHLSEVTDNFSKELVTFFVSKPLVCIEFMDGMQNIRKEVPVSVQSFSFSLSGGHLALLHDVFRDMDGEIKLSITGRNSPTVVFHYFKNRSFISLTLNTIRGDKLL